MPSQRQRITLAITTGDTDGIGLEVTLKALNKLGPRPAVSFIVFRERMAPQHLQSLDAAVSKRFTKDHLQVFDMAVNPAAWVELAAKKCLQNTWGGLITGPLSKETIQSFGFSDVGHTDILKRVSGQSELHMGFLGDYFNVVLATGHLSIRDLPARISVPALRSALRSTQVLCSFLPASLARRPIGLVALNPHAGENGILGAEEQTVYKKFLALPTTRRARCVGPLVPDTAFFKKNWRQFSAFICSYHDQGLIPFKMIHGHKSGVHVTLGLPFIRVSVDHGTAKDIYKKNIADPSSMIRAIQLAEKLALRR